jgi:hypothetical protein
VSVANTLAYYNPELFTIEEKIQNTDPGGIENGNKLACFFLPVTSSIEIKTGANPSGTLH